MQIPQIKGEAFLLSYVKYCYYLCDLELCSFLSSYSIKMTASSGNRW